MSANVNLAGNVGFLNGSASAVFFSKTAANAGSYNTTTAGTSLLIRNIQNALNVAPWGEDNRFPQNIENMMAYCGIGRAALEWKAKMLYGGGIIPGTITGIDPKTQEDIFTPLDRTKYKKVYDFISTQQFFRFMIEYLIDWVWFANCFPEIILSKDGKTITGLVHQESCDARLQQMNAAGEIKKVFLSKLWGASKDQHAKFDPNKKMKGLMDNPQELTEAYKDFISILPCIDTYNATESLRKIAENFNDAKGLKSAILPVNWPSPNKTYYQVATWDGARLSGWIEIAIKIPSMLKTLYQKAFQIKYHIEIPETYFERKYGYEKWHVKTEEEQSADRLTLLTAMDEFLSGDENAFASFVSFFEIDNHDHTEYARVKITAIENKSNIDKELLTSSAADIQTLIAMNVHPTLFGAGTIGTGSQRSGGSDIREAFLVYNASLVLERRVLLQPLYLVRDYNNWGTDIEFRIRDTVLTTLDTGAGTKKVVS